MVHNQRHQHESFGKVDAEAIHVSAPATTSAVAIASVATLAQREHAAQLIQHVWKHFLRRRAHVRMYVCTGSLLVGFIYHNQARKQEQRRVYAEMVRAACVIQVQK